MWRRLKNLWAWSAIDPYSMGQETGSVVSLAIEEIKHILSQPKAEIVYPIEQQPKTAIEGADDLDAALQAISEEANG